MGFGLQFPVSFLRVNPPPPRLVPDSERALAEICLHYRPDFASACGETFSDLLSALPADTDVRVVVKDRADFMSFLDLLQARPVVCRVTPVVTGFEITPWAKDRFGTFESGGRPMIAVPPERAPCGGARENDGRVPERLCSSLRHVGLFTLPFQFEGGDLLSDPEYLYVSPALPGRNAPLTPERRARVFDQLRDLGRTVVWVGDEGHPAPDHHIGMYLTALGDRTLAVGDPEWGCDQVSSGGAGSGGGVLAQWGMETNRAAFVPFRNVQQSVRDQGFTLVRLPMLLTATPRVYVTYNNALVETRDGERRVYMPVYGIPVLDRLAESQFNAAGFRVIPIRVGRVFGYTGSLRCLVGVIARAGG
jgi:hypothetical protein